MATLPAFAGLEADAVHAREVRLCRLPDVTPSRHGSSGGSSQSEGSDPPETGAKNETVTTSKITQSSTPPKSLPATTSNAPCVCPPPSQWQAARIPTKLFSCVARCMGVIVSTFFFSRCRQEKKRVRSTVGRSRPALLLAQHYE